MVGIANLLAPGPVTPAAVWGVWGLLAVLLAAAALHRTLETCAAWLLRAEVRRLKPLAWMLCWAADMWLLSHASRAAIKWLLFAMAVSRLWAMGWPPPPTLMLDAALLGAAALDGVLLVLLAWAFYEARLLRRLVA